MGGISDRELNLISKTSAEFAGKELAKAIETHGIDSYTPGYAGVVQKARDLDFFHMLVPEEAEAAIPDLQHSAPLFRTSAKKTAALQQSF